MLALSHRVLSKDWLVRQGEWRQRVRFMGSELRKKVAGIVDLGGIGSALVGLLLPFRVG